MDSTKCIGDKQARLSTTMHSIDKASYITVQWALQETQNIIHKAEVEADNIRNMASQELREAQQKNHAAWLALVNAGEQADEIVREALEDADDIRLSANQDAHVIRETAEAEFQRFMSIFKDKIKHITIACLQDMI